jgi:hypothetical protein
MGFEPMIRVLQDPTLAIQTLARLWPDSVLGAADSRLPGGPKPLTVFWGQATDNNACPPFRNQATSSWPRCQEAPRAIASDQYTRVRPRPTRDLRSLLRRLSD